MKELKDLVDIVKFWITFYSGVRLLLLVDSEAIDFVKALFIQFL